MYVCQFWNGVPYSSLRTTTCERKRRSDTQGSGAGLSGSGREFDGDGVVDALESSHWEVSERGAAYGVGKGTPGRHARVRGVHPQLVLCITEAGWSGGDRSVIASRGEIRYVRSVPVADLEDGVACFNGSGDIFAC